MDIFVILWPIKWLVELILVSFHGLFSMTGMDPRAGITWVLSIVGLVLVIRSALIPIFVRQIRSQRKMLEIAPQLKKIQEKYKGKRDSISREAMSRETMAMYKSHGTSPFASCLPLLLQMPIFFALFSVLNDTQHGKAGVGLLNSDLAKKFADSKIFEAPLKDTFVGVWNLGGEPWQVMVVAVVMIVLMTSSQFFTQLQIVSKNVSQATKDSPMFRQQRILLYILPFVFLISGVSFPLGVMFYWLTTNIWTAVQQFIVIRNMPNPGTEAEALREARLARKKRLVISEAEISATSTPSVLEVIKPTQRQQPVGKSRAKKQVKK